MHPNPRRNSLVQTGAERLETRSEDKLDALNLTSRAFLERLMAVRNLKVGSTRNTLIAD